MRRYTTDANTTLQLEDGQTIGPDQLFVTEFRPEQEASLLACGAITRADDESIDLGPHVGAITGDLMDGGVDVEDSSNNESPAGDPGHKE